MKMKHITCALLAAAATAFIIPDGAMSDQISLSANVNNVWQDDMVGDEDLWWSKLALSNMDDLLAGEAAAGRGHSMDHTLDRTLDSINTLAGSVVSSYAEDDDDRRGGGDDHHGHDHDHGHHGHHGHHGNSSRTIYELIHESKHTRRFAELVDEYDDIKELLQETKHNHTLFVPTDEAFEHIPHHGDDDKKPSKEFVRKVLEYHIVHGCYSAKRMLFASHTLPTELELGSLGEPDRRQRLRVGVNLLGGGVGGLRLNFYSRVVAADFEASNGVIHAVDKILVPPPHMARIIKAFPNTFSTFSLAMETTGLGEELAERKEKENWRGGTLFAPTNFAFAKLGPRLNAFLFSEHGKKYLRALIKYHVVANETLYSDAYYHGHENDHEGQDDGEEKADGYYRHVDLPSLLDDKPIRVDIIRRFAGFHISMRVNGFGYVSVQDGVAEDGVIQVVSSVLFPPHGDHHSVNVDDDQGEEIGEGDAMSVDGLKERLAPYLDEPLEREQMGDLQFLPE
ncbi:Fasciclin domain-containing protein [Diplogelasinospora grovesii]|uniref:Fasciclin domain-containing protein n=1 Tax=Diplogelasinospora grovesii TaxID=303347 RepID=A0AAN6S387_9PEZI|nr:Fasciclin domain-containing protein [Diplogelasinospora grovesii]